MKDEVILKILDKCSEFLVLEQTQQLRTVLNSELYDYEVQPAVRSLVPITKAPEMLHLYLASKKLDGLALSTLKSYSRYLKKFLFCIQKEVETINTMDCRVYLAKYSSSGVKNTTLNTISTTLRAFFSWLVNNDYILKNPMNSIKSIKTDKYIRKALTFEELEMLRDSCKSIREKALVEFFYSTGCRLDEVKKLNISDIDWNSKSTFVVGKGSKERQVFLTASAVIHLKKYIKSRKDLNEALFVGERAPHQRLGNRAIERVYKLLGERAGIKKAVYPHLVRHTTATHMLRRGASMTEVQKLLGHTSPATTQIYAQLDNEALMQSHRKHVS
jgi:integrase/recombinase XerD